MTLEHSYKPRDWKVHPPVSNKERDTGNPRKPQQPMVPLSHTLSEITGPVYGHGALTNGDDDLTHNAVRNGEPLGERMVVSGRVLDEDGRPLAGTLIEIWQANAAGRYAHNADGHDAPVDPNFMGTGRCVTDKDGRYRFTTIRPGSYPLPFGDNLWRPAHIHYSLFGPSFVSRLITQSYFPGDPLLEFDAMYNSIPDKDARDRLVASFERDAGTPGFALGYVFDIVLRGRNATPLES